MIVGGVDPGNRASGLVVLQVTEKKLLSHLVVRHPPDADRYVHEVEAVLAQLPHFPSLWAIEVPPPSSLRTALFAGVWLGLLGTKAQKVWLMTATRVRALVFGNARLTAAQRRRLLLEEGFPDGLSAHEYDALSAAYAGYLLMRSPHAG